MDITWHRIVLPMLLWLPCTATAGWSGFLRLDSIQGESQDTNHVGWMDVQSVAGVNLANSSGANQPVIGQLCLQKMTDTASPQLALDCAQDTVIRSGTLDLTTATNSIVEFLRLNLNDLVIGSVEQSGSTGSDARPNEELCVVSQVISWNYTQFSPPTGLPSGYYNSSWNFSANNGSASMSQPVFTATGIRRTNGVELNWTATVGTNYRIYAVPGLSQPFVPLGLITATNTGPMSYTFTPVSPAMFFVVEQVPTGF